MPSAMTNVGPRRHDRWRESWRAMEPKTFCTMLCSAMCRDVYQAVDVEVYRAVMQIRGDDGMDEDVEPDELPCRSEFFNSIFCVRAFDAAETRMRRDFSSLKTVWTNSFLKDWWIFQCNMHPLLACIRSHQLHIISRRERWGINFMLVMLSVHLAVTSTETQQCVAYQLNNCALNYTDTRIVKLPWKEYDDTDWYSKGQKSPPEDVCCELNKLGLVWSFQRFGPIGLNALLAVVTVAVSLMWFQFAACGCIQQCGRVLRTRGERVGHCLLWFFSIVIITPMPLYLLYLFQTGLLMDTFLNFLLVKGTTLIGAFGTLTLAFIALWHLEKFCTHKAYGKRFYIKWSDKDAQDATWAITGIDISGDRTEGTRERIDSNVEWSNLRQSYEDTDGCDWSVPDITPDNTPRGGDIRGDGESMEIDVFSPHSPNSPMSPPMHTMQSPPSRGKGFLGYMASPGNQANRKL